MFPPEKNKELINSRGPSTAPLENLYQLENDICTSWRKTSVPVGGHCFVPAREHFKKKVKKEDFTRSALQNARGNGDVSS